MNNKELLPCPFCGGETKIDNRGECGYGIVCISCGAKSPDFQTETNAIKSWNDYAKDWLKMEQIEPEISLDGIHPDLTNGLLKAKRNSSEIPNSSKEMPLVPKWQVWGYNGCILRIPISQQDALQFIVSSFKNNKYICEVGISVSEVEEIGTFNTLEEAKAKVNECIRELGERLMYFADNINIKE